MSEIITLEYSCGHGTYELELDSNDPKKNENRIKWNKENRLCNECYKKKMREEEKKKPKVINCIYEKDDKNCYITFFAEGNVNENIDDLKSIGFKWNKTEHIKPNNKKYNTWELKFRYLITSLKDMKEYLDIFRDSVNALGYKLYSDMFAMPMEDIQKDIEQFNKNKPKYNNCYEFLKKEFGILKFNAWNRMVYSPKFGPFAGKHVCYFDNKEYCITNEQYKLIKKYQDKLEEYYVSE